MKKKEYILEYDMVFANLFSVIIMLVMILFTYGLIRLTFNPFESIMAMEYSEFTFYSVMFFILYLFWMVLHEIIHGLTYQIMGADSKDIVYGARIEKSVFYCKCKNYIKRKCIITSLMAPFVLIGVLTYIIAFIFKLPMLLILSIFNIIGCSGDLMMFFFFMKQDKDIEFKEMGFSSPFCIKTKEDISNKKYLGIKNIRLVKDEKETTEPDEKKITISGWSWAFIGLIVVVCVINIVTYLLVK